MVVILEAVAGPVTGRRIEVKAGTILRIGRTARADYALGEDGYLSSLHFAVECDGSQCRVRDLGSSNGTFLNGNKVVEQIVEEGDSLTAGGSTFTIHLDVSTPAPSLPMNPSVTKTTPTPVLTAVHTFVDRQHAAAPAVALWQGFSKAHANLLQALYQPGEPVFAILDATRDSRIPAFLDASGEAFIPVDPTGRVPLFIAAPAPGSRLLDVLVKDGWGRGWCSYATSPVTLHEACAHLASYLTLYTVHGNPFISRFWDPRILRVLAPQMTQDEGVVFFGPFTRMVIEGEKPEMALELTLTPRGPRQQAVML